MPGDRHQSNVREAREEGREVVDGHTTEAEPRARKPPPWFSLRFSLFLHFPVVSPSVMRLMTVGVGNLGTKSREDHMVRSYEAT